MNVVILFGRLNLVMIGEMNQKIGLEQNIKWKQLERVVGQFCLIIRKYKICFWNNDMDNFEMSFVFL